MWWKSLSYQTKLKMQSEGDFLEYKIIPGFRKNSNLLQTVNEDQLYKFKNSQNNIKYYNCYHVGCPVNVAVDLNNGIYCRKIKKNIQHNHVIQTETINKMNLVNAIKAKCSNTMSLKRSTVREIYDDQCKKAKKETAQSLEFGKMRRQLINIRSEVYPKAPRNFADVIRIYQNINIQKNFAFSRFDNELPMYRNTIIEAEFGYSIFASPTICNDIMAMSGNEPRNYLIDGTFNVIPSSDTFKQLLIIHFAHAGHVSDLKTISSFYILFVVKYIFITYVHSKYLVK